MALLARDIMETRVVTILPDAPLSEAADLFFRKRIGGAPVVEKTGGRILGLLSRSDLMRFPLYRGAVAGMVGDYLRKLAAADGADEEGQPPPSETSLADELASHTVREAMASEPITVAPSTPVREVARIMLERHLHRVIVAEQGELRGVISSLDLVRLVADRD